MQEIKYGQIEGGELGFDYVVASGQTIGAGSARFVKRTGASTDTVTILGSTDAEMIGWLVLEPIPNSVNTSTTLGTEVRKVIHDLTAVFRIPINSGTFVHYMVGKTCDLTVSANIQGAALDASTYDQVIIVGGDLADNKWVDVKMNPSKLYVTGVV